jgi:hypothetical protein
MKLYTILGLALLAFAAGNFQKTKKQNLGRQPLQKLI